MIRRPAQILLALAALACVIPGVAQARVPKVFFGITQGGTVQQPDYQKMQDTKVRTMRISVNWKQVEPQPGDFRWGNGANAGNVDNRVAILAQHGITPLMSMYGAPQWATGSTNQAVPPLKGSALQAWKTFLKKAVQRYKKGGVFWRDNPTIPEKPVNSWQIWNEPNLAKYFAKPGNAFPADPVPHAAKAYAKFVKASDKAVGGADKHAKVILAGLSGNAKSRATDPHKFIKKFLKVKKVTKHFNAAALHPYASSIRDYKNRVSKFRKALNRGGAKKKPIWLTEVGWGSASNGQRLNKGIAGQAKLLRKSFKLTLKNRKKWKIGRLFWFDWRDPAPGAPVGCSFCPSAGLLRHDGSAKPAYNNFKRFAKKQGSGGHHHRRHHRR
jgi:hypothetical protein